MAIGHIAIRPHSRKEGHTVSAAARYRTGTCGTCPRTGVWDDYSRRADRQEIVKSGIEAPRPTPIGGSINRFIEAVEGAETRSKARLLRDVQVALPHELPEHRQTALLKDFAGELGRQYDTVPLWAHHRADPRGDQRNGHGHILLPTRALSEDGRSMGKKIRRLDDRRTGPIEVAWIRNRWQDVTNRHLAQAGINAPVHVGRRTDRKAAITLGTTVAAVERKAAIEAGIEVKGMSVAQLLLATDPVTDVGKVAREEQLEWRAMGLAEPEYEAQARTRFDRWLDDLPDYRQVPEVHLATWEMPVVDPHDLAVAGQAVEETLGPEPDAVAEQTVEAAPEAGVVAEQEETAEADGVAEQAVEAAPEAGVVAEQKETGEPDAVAGQAVEETLEPEPDAVAEQTVEAAPEAGVVAEQEETAEADGVAEQAVEAAPEAGVVAEQKETGEPDAVAGQAVEETLGPEPDAVAEQAVEAAPEAGVVAEQKETGEPDAVAGQAVEETLGPEPDAVAEQTVEAAPEAGVVAEQEETAEADGVAEQAVEETPEPESNAVAEDRADDARHSALMARIEHQLKAKSEKIKATKAEITRARSDLRDEPQRGDLARALWYEVDCELARREQERAAGKSPSECEIARKQATASLISKWAPGPLSPIRAASSARLAAHRVVQVATVVELRIETLEERHRPKPRPGGRRRSIGRPWRYWDPAERKRRRRRRPKGIDEVIVEKAVEVAADFLALLFSLIILNEIGESRTQEGGRARGSELREREKGPDSG